MIHKAKICLGIDNLLIENFDYEKEETSKDADILSEQF